MTGSGMRPVLTADAMRAADEFTIEEFGISGFTLMETAGRGAARLIEQECGGVAGRTVAVYCGKGNNGGDGFVTARCLYDRGATVHVLSLGHSGELSDDAEANFALLEKLAGRDRDRRLFIGHDPESLPDNADVHVDALLGTGLTSELREPILSIVRQLNALKGLKVAVDIPTGLHTDLGRPLGDTFHADLTVTMGALKTGLCVNEGRAVSGRLEVVDIGIPAFALAVPVDAGQRGCARLTSDAAVRAWMPPRAHDAHKYSVGLALVVAGSAGMTGAPVMASSAAARVGAGYVVCACDYRIQSTLGLKMTEVTSVPLPASEAGIDPPAAMNAVRERLEKARGVLIGCGLGRDPATQEFVRRFLVSVEQPVVIDADGLNALAGHMEIIRKNAGGRWILTPHMGEFKRLAGSELERVGLDEDDHVALAQHFAAEWNCVLLLKGLPSVVASPDGRAWINATGNAALATAGTGDVLAGMCAGLLAQGVAPERAAVAAMHIGGAAADRYAAHLDGRSMQAMDLLAEIPSILRERFHVQ